MRLIAERHENEYSYKIYKDHNEEEFTVMFYFKSIHIGWMNYYTNDEKDARAIAKKQIFEFLKEDMKRGA